MRAKKKLAVLSTAALMALSLGALAACAEEGHSLSYVKETAATCTEAGHEAYYLCSHCGKLFADENAETELSEADVAIAALGHSMTHHAAVAATCTEDGNLEYWSCSRCALNFSDEAGTKELASVTVPAGHDIAWAETIEPTVAAEGMLAHYECGKCHTCYEDADGKKEIAREDLVLAKLVEQAVTITVEVYDTSENKVNSPDFTAISGELSLLGAYSSNRYEGLTVESSGTLKLTSAIVGDYTVDLYGYRRSTFTIEQGTDTYTLKLYQTIAYGSNDKVTVDDKAATITIKGSVADYNNNLWSGSAKLVLPEDVADSAGAILSFTVKNVTNSQEGWPTPEWGSQRIAIQMAKGNEGFLFFMPKGEANIFDMTDAFLKDEGKTRLGESSSTYAWVNTLMRGQNGVNMRLVRTGELVTLFAQNDQSAWVKIGSVGCAAAATDIIFYGCGVEWAFSSVAVQKLTYHARVEATPQKPGNHAYYTDGTNYWFEDGEETTQAGTVLYAPVTVSLTIKGIALDGTTEEEVPDGTVITFKSRAATYTYTVGGKDLTEMVAGDYTVTAEGYRAETLKVSTAGGAIELTLTKVITIGKGVVELTGNAWNGKQALPVPEDLSKNFLMEFTIKMSDFTQGAGELGAWQRYAIRLTEGNVGFYFWSWDNGGHRTFIRQFGANNLNDAKAENTPVNGDEANNGYILTELLSTDGLQLRILRAGNTFCLYAKNGGNWVRLGTVSCAAGDKIDMEVYAGVGTYEWSSGNFTEVTHVAEKQPVSATEPGNIEHYTDGTNYWLPDGTMTTLADTIVKYAAEVTLTIEGVGLDGTSQEAVPNGTVITFTNGKNTYTYTVGQAEAFKLAPDTYNVSAYGYGPTKLVVTEGQDSYTLKLNKTIANGSNDKVTVDDKNGTITIEQQAMGSDQAWTGSAQWFIPEEITGDFVFEGTLKISGFENGWTTAGTQQRYAIRLTEGNAGFYFWSWETGGNKTHIYAFTVNGTTNNLINAMGQGADVNGDEAGLGFITSELQDADGLQLRILRVGNTFYLYAQNGGNWVKLGSVTCADGDKTDIAFYGVQAGYEWSSLSMKSLTHVPEKPAESVGNPGNIEHYTDGTNYWLPDGTMTTKEDVAVPFDEQA